MNRNTGRTWWKTGHIPWNMGMKYVSKIPKTGKTIVCKLCGKKKYFELNQLKKRPCLYCSVLCARKSEKKDKLAYSSVHSRISREWGKAKVCEYCNQGKTVDWANISKKYLLDKLDWLQLCRKHHIAYDRGNLLIKSCI